MDPLRETFEHCTFETLRDWVTARKQEDLHLDFKLILGDRGFGKDDQRNFSKALSAFANSDGGIVVWGVEAKKDADGIDAACGLMPVASAAAVLSRLHSLTGELVSPIVDGVDHRVIPDPDGGGYLLSYIPASDSGPHMARGAEHRCYYKRSGDSFYAMEHFDIADMFGRRRKPDLHLALARPLHPKGPRRNKLTA